MEIPYCPHPHRKSDNAIIVLQSPMNLTAYNILVIIALLLAVAGIVKPQYPLVAVAVLLMCVAMLIGGK